MQLYAHVQPLSLDFHSQNQTGELISRMTISTRFRLLFRVARVSGHALTLLGMATIVFYLNWRFMIALSIIPCCSG